jgi:hypothetical protein
VELIAMRDMHAEADIFVNYIICRFSCPEKLMTDRGSQFTSAMFKRSCKRLGIKKIWTTGCHPSSNGRVERDNQFLAPALNAWADPEHEMIATNCNHCCNWDFSVFLDVRRQPTLPTDVLCEDKETCGVDERACSLKIPRILRVTRDRAQKVQEMYDFKMKEYHDRAHKSIGCSVGQKVVLFTPHVKPGLSKKLKTRNKIGYVSVEQNSIVNYTIAPGVKGERTQRVHVQRLMPPKEKSGQEPETTSSGSGDSGLESRPVQADFDEPKVLSKRFSPSVDWEFLLQNG